ncbi:MAG: glycosyltransferase family 4 protein, partial [Candidatus ainarchaeum sp.]|nr:glycosyltransferase family 4 protein [Candidatus ainarchaeum sp.]
MMEKMKVFLNLMGSHHSVYAELLKYPPENVSYSYPETKGLYGQSFRPDSLSRKVLKAIYSPLPALYYVRGAGHADLIHSTNSLMLLNNKNWVVDTEHVGGFLRFRSERYSSVFYKNIISRILRRNSCKGILTWSEAAKKSLSAYFGDASAIIKKTRTIYPAVHPSDKPTQKPKKKFRFLFVSRLFYEKGGREILEAFMKTKKKIDCSLTFIGNAPEEFRNKYSAHVDFVEPRLNRTQMAETFSRHHALVFPTYADTFGFVILEAMAAGLPVISTNVFCVPELIKDGSSGIVLEAPVKWHDEHF